jgi:hypothetical protein
MAKTSISFLYNFDLGNRNVDNPGSNILYVTSTKPGDFDVSNILTESTRHCWRSNDILVAQEIIIKAELNTNIDCFAILGHNFTDTAVVKIQANVSNNFIAPPVTRYLAYNDYIMMTALAFGANYQYYKISILDPANPDGYIQIGKVIGGRMLQFDKNEDITDSYSVAFKDMSDTMKTEGFFRQSTENVTVRTLSCSFSKLRTDLGSNANYSNLRSMFNYVKTTRPFLTILDPQNPYQLSLWGQLQDIPDESYGTMNYVSIPMKVDEVF